MFYLEKDIRSIKTNLKSEKNKIQGKTILLTGGCGFLGKYFIEVINHLNKDAKKKLD